MNESIYEILLKVSKQSGNKARSEELSKYKNDFGIKVILDLVYNPNIKFLLPETDPPSPLSTAPSTLKTCLKRTFVCLSTVLMSLMVSS